MGKYDKLFEKIVTNDELASELGMDARRYKTVADAKKAVTNKKVRAIAEIIRTASSGQIFLYKINTEPCSIIIDKIKRTAV